MRQLSSNSKVVRILNGQAAGTSDTLTSSAIDMRGYESVQILAAFGTITSSAVTTFKVQQSSDDGSADDYSDILGSAQSVADTSDNKQLLCEIHRPTKRYLKALITRATANAVVDGIWAILFNPIQAAPAIDATTMSVEVFVSPAEGTA